MATALRSRQPGRVAATLGNTLERVASARYREVEQMEAALLAAGALGAAMSGSGLTVFGIARSYDHARQIRGRVARAAGDAGRSGRCAAPRSACAEAHGSARCRQ